MSGSENNDDKTSNYGSGFLEISEKGFGFLRTVANHFHPKPTDIFVTPDTIRRSFLREGSYVAGPTQPPHRGTSPQLKAVDRVNEMQFEEYTKAVRFENLTTIDPIEKFNLETSPATQACLPSVPSRGQFHHFLLSMYLVTIFSTTSAFLRAC